MANEISTVTADEHYGIDTGGMAAGLALLFNDRLYERCKDVARVMAGAKGVTPGHLINNPEACFGIIQMSVTWKLTPQLVAFATYQTPGGKIGFEGKLVQAIIENSGKVEGNVKYELVGDWDQVRGKFKMAKSAKGNDYHVAAWAPDDEKGLGVIATAQVKGEAEPRTTGIIYLNSCWPRNSTLWALRPEQQIKYLAARVLANTVMPGIFMGVPIEGDVDDEGMKDVTPRPQPEGAGSFYSGKAPAEEPKAEPAKVEGPPAITNAAQAWDAGIKANHNGEKIYDFPKGLPEELKEDFKGGWREAEEARPHENRMEAHQELTNSADNQSSQDPAEGKAGEENQNASPADPQGSTETAKEAGPAEKATEPAQEAETPPMDEMGPGSEENGPADAYEAGRAARASDKKSFYAVPDEWKSHAEPWQSGWTAEDEEMKAKGKKK